MKQLLALGRRWHTAFLAVLLIFLLLFPWLGVTSYQHHLLTFVFLYVTLASAWNIIGGYTGYVSLGHAFFFGVGAYTVAILLRDFPVLFEISEYSPFALAILGGLVSAVFGVIVGWIALRTRGSAFVIVTIALLLMGRLTVGNLEFTGGTYGITLPIPSWDRDFFPIPFYYVLLALAVFTVYASHKIRHSRFGMGLIAIREDEGKASMVGINTTLYKVLAFTLSTLFVGIAGGVWAHSRSFIDPGGMISLTISGNMIIMTLLGGSGTVWGPVIGATLLGLSNQVILSEFGTSELNRAITGLVLVGVVIAYPAGIMGLLEELRDRIRGITTGDEPPIVNGESPASLETLHESEKQSIWQRMKRGA